MSDIVNLIFSRDNFLQIFILVFSVIYTSGALFVFKQINKTRIKEKNTFIDTFIKGISERTIENYDDLMNVYSGITRLSIEDLTNRQNMNKWLREILAKLINKDVGKDLGTEQLLEMKNKISQYIKDNELISPFTDLPETERNIINDISSYNKLGEKESVDRKINELSSVIITRHEQQKKIESLNKWSIPIAIIGIILTVLFGIISLL